MKRRLSYILAVALAVVGVTAMSNNTGAATLEELEKKSGKSIKALLYDENGNEVVVYDDEDSATDSVVELQTTGKSRSDIAAYSSSSALVYTSTLGVYENGTKAKAKSKSSRGINQMDVLCQAFYKSGNSIGLDRQISPAGWTVSAYYAEVKVPANPFNFKVASARSTHSYSCAGYKGFTQNLKWPK